MARLSHSPKINHQLLLQDLSQLHWKSVSSKRDLCIADYQLLLRKSFLMQSRQAHCSDAWIFHLDTQSNTLFAPGLQHSIQCLLLDHSKILEELAWMRLKMYQQFRMKLYVMSLATSFLWVSYHYLALLGSITNKCCHPRFQRQLQHLNRRKLLN